MADTGTESIDGDSHWVRWHRSYEDPVSPLSVRLRLVQDALRAGIDAVPPGPVRIVSLCAGQGRDVIDVVAGHQRAADISALLVEFDPGLVAFARQRAEEAGVTGQVTVVEGNAAESRHYAEAVPAHVVLVCGIFGNISAADVTAIIDALPTFCGPGAHVIWTRHRRPPDRTPAVRADFAAAGFEEVSFAAPDGYVLSVGLERYPGQAPRAFDPDLELFTFVGDGALPA
ncbi:MAG TPA: class I SAM-dependent methyltransferase family protein [Acidimicrobiales bacterium]|jgi:hypothetical protein